MKEKPKNNYLKIELSVLVVILIAVAIVIIVMNNNADKNEKELAYDNLLIQIRENNVEKMEMTDGSTTVKVKLKNK